MKSGKKLGFLDFLILVLSIYVLIALVIDTLFKLDKETSLLLDYIDTGICIIFFLDFVVQFSRAENKLRFMRWGWIDLVSSIPSFNVLRFGRLFRLIRLIRVVRSFKSIYGFAHHVFSDRAEGSLILASSVAFMFIIFSSIAILQFENAPTSNIKTAEDALWWSVTTITTVGYGDKYPVTTEGRILAMILMLVGVGVFGSYTAYLASYFVRKPDDNSNHSAEKRAPDEAQSEE